MFPPAASLKKCFICHLTIPLLCFSSTWIERWHARTCSTVRVRAVRGDHLQSPLFPVGLLRMRARVWRGCWWRSQGGEWAAWKVELAWGASRVLPHTACSPCCPFTVTLVLCRAAANKSFMGRPPGLSLWGGYSFTFKAVSLSNHTFPYKNSKSPQAPPPAPRQARHSFPTSGIQVCLPHTIMRQRWAKSFHVLSFGEGTFQALCSEP